MLKATLKSLLRPLVHRARRLRQFHWRRPTNLLAPVLPDVEMPEASAGEDLGAWMCRLPHNRAYQEIAAALGKRADLRSLTSPDEMTTLVLLVRRLRHKRFLEIGTAF